MSRKFIINVNGKSYDVEVTEVAENQQQKPAEVKTPVVPAVSTTTAPKPPVKSEQVQSVPAGADKVTAPMPGTILKVNVENGRSIKKGQVLLILEAMKMENEIVSPVDGTIASIHISNGSRVNAGDVLVSIG